MSDNQQCFIARPVGISDEQAKRYRDGQHHWQHVHDHLIVPAIIAAGYDPIPPTSTGATNIHADIIRNLKESQLVVADFSTLNANVLYEAGIRTAINQPLVLIAEDGTDLPFDTRTISTYFYKPALDAWDLPAQVVALTDHIKATPEEGNALWRHFGIELTAANLDTTGNPEAARLELFDDRLEEISMTLAHLSAQNAQNLLRTDRVIETVLSGPRDTSAQRDPASHDTQRRRSVEMRENLMQELQQALARERTFADMVAAGAENPQEGHDDLESQLEMNRDRIHRIRAEVRALEALI